jgi:hypothetical protein
MVKRTLVVLAILSLMAFAATSVFAFGSGWSGQCAAPAPCFVPVKCAPYPAPTTIIKTWSCKIVGPCPAPGPACCGSQCDTGRHGCMLCSAATAIASPFDLLFGGCDGVYGCFGGGSGGLCGGDGPCGPCWGPVPRVLAGVPMILGAPTVMFGTMW